MPRRYPPEFRRRVLDLIAEGRSVASAAADLGMSGQTIYTWRRQGAMDRGEASGVTTTEQIELARARRRIRELEEELALTPASAGRESCHPDHGREVALGLQASQPPYAV